MELKDFISQTIVAILDGVSDARRQKGEDIVNPGITMRISDKDLHSRGELVAEQGRIIREVQFDVAVTTAEGTGTKGGIGIFVAGLGLGSQGQTDKATSSVSRITFSVPITFTPMRKPEQDSSNQTMEGTK